MKVLMVHEYYRQAGGEDKVFEKEKQLLKKEGIDVIEYTWHNSKINMGELKNIFLNKGISAQVYNELKKIIKSERVDVVWCHNLYPYLLMSVYQAAKDSNCKLIHTLHNYRLICLNATFYNYQKQKICTLCLEKSFRRGLFVNCSANILKKIIAYNFVYNFWANEAYEKVDKFVVLTKFAYDIFKKIGIPEHKLFIKPNFIFEDEVDMPRGVGDYALFVGRLTYEKGILDLINAMNYVKRDIKLLIVGNGYLEALIRKVLDKYKLTNVHLIGWKSPDEVAKIISNARLLILPSKWYEGFPMVILEAYSKGRPVLAHNVGGIKEIVFPDVNGWLVNNLSAKEFAKNIEHAYEVSESFKSEYIVEVLLNKWSATTNYNKYIKSLLYSN